MAPIIAAILQRAVSSTDNNTYSCQKAIVTPLLKKRNLK